MNAKEKKLYEQAEELWEKSCDELNSLEDKLSSSAFLGAHYAIGALRGYWSPSESGFLVIKSAIEEMERTLLEDYQQSENLRKTESNGSEHVPVPASEIVPWREIKWRVVRKEIEPSVFVFECSPVNGNSVRKYCEYIYEDEDVEVDGEEISSSKVPDDVIFQWGNFDDAVLPLLQIRENFQYIGNGSKPYDGFIVIDGYYFVFRDFSYDEEGDLVSGEIPDQILECAVDNFDVYFKDTYGILEDKNE